LEEKETINATAIVAICPSCNKVVDKEKQLYVIDELNIYHYSCYNYMKAKQKE